MKCYRMHARFLVHALALVVALTLTAPPAFAAEPANSTSARPISGAASARVATLPAEVLAQATPAPPAAAVDAGNKPFFKTTKGAIALVLIAGTLGYMAYSMSSDRVRSPAK